MEQSFLGAFGLEVWTDLVEHSINRNHIYCLTYGACNFNIFVKFISKKIRVKGNLVPLIKNLH